MEAASGYSGDTRAEWLNNNRDAPQTLDNYIVQAERSSLTSRSLRSGQR
ncbi:hypothetical protein [Spirosoma foliorum]|uniref:Uncharacterized protein n=1 Tax=Spirosoma foliorum TaxID=2710596 RepID=A0A7G5H2P8_9BACT|nr:hypothetical protein [Spirosoma foliorum]QMW05390.1 hypothetical protein H3H32_11100 [Spirosoma foliorum]